MGDKDFRQTELLSEKRKAKIASLAREHYETLMESGEFPESARRMGTEHEGTILYPDGSLTTDIAAKIIAEFNNPKKITEEFGSYQVEVITGPVVQDPSCIDNLYAMEKAQRAFIQEYALANDARFVPIGLVPTVNAADLEALGDEAITEVDRYKILLLEGQRTKTSCTIDTLEDKITLPGALGISLINSTHIHLQARNAEDAVKLFNYSQMLAPIILALSANSQVFDKKPLPISSQQMKIFEQAIPKSSGLQRCELYPGYVKTINDYFEYALSHPPILDPGDGNGMPVEQKAFNLTVGLCHSWLKARTENNHFRVELRSVNVQPSTKEDMALVQLYILGVQAQIDYKKPLLPFEFVQENFERAARDGIDAKLYWPARGRITQLPASLIGHEVMGLAERWGRQNNLLSNLGEELIDLIRYRTEERMTPGKKFAQAIEKHGFDHAFAEYSKHAILDKPYISRE